MPVNVVKNASQEQSWERAKRIVGREYPKVKEGSAMFYRLVMSIYQNLIGKGTKLEKALRG